MKLFLPNDQTGSKRGQEGVIWADLCYLTPAAWLVAKILHTHATQRLMSHGMMTSPCANPVRSPAHFRFPSAAGTFQTTGFLAPSKLEWLRGSEERASLPPSAPHTQHGTVRSWCWDPLGLKRWLWQVPSALQTPLGMADRAQPVLGLGDPSLSW